MEFSNLWQYEVVSYKYDTLSKPVITYGLCVKNTDILVHDISSDKDFVGNCAKMFNQFQLSPIHLKDVLEDILYS